VLGNVICSDLVPIRRKPGRVRNRFNVAQVHPAGLGGGCRAKVGQSIWRAVAGDATI